MGRRHRSSEDRDGVAVGGKEHADVGSGVIGTSEERQSDDVVPVEVAEDNRPGERRTLEERSEHANAGAGVEDQRGGTIVSERDTRRVAAGPQVCRARGRARSAYPEDPGPHQVDATVIPEVAS